MEKNPAKDIAAEMRLQQNMEREVESIKDKMDALDEMAKVWSENEKTRTISYKIVIEYDSV